MKKFVILAIWAASVSAYALPTYEPFTEFAGQIVSNGTNLVVTSTNGVPLGTNANSQISNCLDLATGGYTAPGGESWGSLNYSGTFGTGLHGLDIAVISNSTIFTSSALSTILPSTFPGFPTSGGIATIVENPAQPFIWGTTSYVVSPNTVGNSAVLKFSQDIARPTNGTKTIYVSYLFSVAQQGQLGSGNDGRYMAFLSSSNLVEGPTTSTYTNWASLFNTFTGSSAGGVHYASQGIIQDGTSFYIGACDSAIGKTFATSPFVSAYNNPNFVVGAYTFASGSGVKDTNTVWVNPILSSFGGATPPATPIQNDTMAFNMSDIGGLVLIDRVGSGATGGVGTNYIANLIVGTTWSYVTGGPEFTTQPAGVNVVIGANASLAAGATAAGQNVSYQWQKVTGGTTNNLTDGTGTAGGTATVSGSSTANLNLTDISSADLGIYQVVATASSTGFTLSSSQAGIISDPVINSQPQNANVNYGSAAAFTASITTSKPTLTYQWYNGSTPLINGLQADGSTVFGASGTIAGGSNTLTLTVSNVSYLGNGNSYSLYATNNVNNSVLTSAGALTVNDPYIITQPANQSIAAGSTATFTVSASGNPTLTYQWYEAGNALSDGVTISGSTISGSQTATLAISGTTAADNGSYYVAVSGPSGQITNSTSVNLVAESAVVTTQTLRPLTERVGDHLAFVVGATGGGLSYQWQLNGTNISGATSTSLVLTNIQTTNAGTYTVVIQNVVSTNTASATLTVVNSTLLPLAATNIVVVRVGDGVQALSGATGNTIYLDQYTPSGTYVSTVQVPDEGVGQAYGTGSAASVPGSPALLAQGAGTDAPNGMILTLSGGPQQFLTFAGYCAQYPFSGADVTIGATAGIYWRGLATINAFGLYSLAYTNSGLYSGGNHTIRGTVTLDDVNFWTTGQAGSGSGIKFINTTNAAIANGNGILSISSSAAAERVVQIVGTNLVFSDLAGASGPGIYACAGIPEPTAGTPGSAQLINEGGQPNDFAFSPDNQTVYIADSQQFGGTNVQSGGIQRWDTNSTSGGWTYSYTIAPVNGSFNGAQGLTAYFPPTTTSWGPGVTGAILYATSYDTSTNSLTQIVDNGPASTATVIATAGVNQALRGVRFGPTAVPVSIASQPQSQTNFPGNSVTFSVVAGGTKPFFYQWQYNGTAIPGATGSSFTTNNLSFASAGNYSVIVSNLVPSSITSSNAVLTVVAGAPVFAYGVPSYIEAAGDHLAFSPVINGSLPFNAQWYFNTTNNPLAGATNTSLVLTNIQTGQSGTYLLYVSNVYGNNHGSGTLTVTATPLALSSNNLVIARIGDGVQALSGATGNTLYLDQYTPSGTYVSSIQVPDEGTGQPYGTGGASSSSLPFGSPALLVAGGNTDNDAAFQAFLSRSGDGQTINFAGYCEAYPFAGPDVSVGATGGSNWRGVGGVNAFGYYSLDYTNTGLYSGGNHQMHAAVTLDQTNYWSTGEAGSVGVKYITPAFEPASGNGIATVGGSDAGTRIIQIFNNNLVFSDGGSSPMGIYEFSGTPQGASTPQLLVAETNSPMDFAISPDSATVYIADNGTFGGTNAQAGGIQRWDADPINGGYAFSYTLATGAGSTAGARGLTVDFSSQTVWGAGIKGAKLYATTAEFSGNRLIKIIDNGLASSAATLVTANPSNTLSGVKFGPSALPVSIASQPQNQIAVAGTGAIFTVGAAGTPPFYYQWQFNGTNIPGATQSSLTVGPAQAVLPGNYSVIVSNQSPSSILSDPASISIVPVLGFNGGVGWSMNGTAGSGLPIYNYGGTSNMVELTQSVGGQGASTFYDYPVYVGGFLATWTYQVVSPSGTVADGTAFVVQNDSRGTAAIGSPGGTFAYGSPGGITNSAALEFNIYSGVASGVGIALDTNAAIGPNIATGPVVLNGGDPINVTLQYLNGVATVTLIDAVTSDTFTTNAIINIPAVVGGNQAYVGFTGADGGTVSTQTVSNFVFTSIISLSASNTGGNSLALTWPLGAGGYTLQQNSDLSTTNWINTTGIVNVTNGANQATVPITNTNTFYRLVIP